MTLRAALAVLASALAACAEPRTLRYRFEEGATIRTRDTFVEHEEWDRWMGRTPRTATHAFEFESRWTIVDVSASGSATIATTIEAVHVRGGEGEFDSRAGLAPTSLAAEAASALVGATTIWEVSPLGRLDAVGGSGGGAEWASLRQRCFADLILLGVLTQFPILPADGAAPGDRWEREYRIPVDAIVAELSLTFRYALPGGEEPVGGDRLQFEIEPIQIGRRTILVEPTNLRSEGTGHISIDVRTGLPIATEWTIESTMDVESHIPPPIGDGTWTSRLTIVHERRSERLP